MILACSACGTRYHVDQEDLAGSAGRTVRCANCGHTWHQSPPAIEASAHEAAASIQPLRGAGTAETVLLPPVLPRLEIPLRPQPAPPLTLRWRRHRWPALGWGAAVVLVLLVVFAISAGIFARHRVAAMWPPAGRFYASIGLPVAPSGAGLVIGKIAPARTADGLMIDGEVANPGSTPREVPRLRVALQDAAEKEVQFEVVDPPKTQLQPGEIVHFAMPFAHPVDTATGVVVTFASP
jgi:predicted Zn finger-like uncharacterized protein